MNEFSFDTQLGSQQIKVDVHIFHSLETIISFCFLDNCYSFNINKWTSQKFRKLYNISPYFTPKNMILITKNDKYQIIFQAIKDLFCCLNQLVLTYPKSMADYAIYYKQNHKNIKNYNQYITKLTCNCIINSNFIINDFSNKLIEFKFENIQNLKKNILL